MLEVRYEEGHCKDLLRLLRLDAFSERNIVLSNGRKSDFFLDVKKVLLTSEGLFTAAMILRRIVEQQTVGVRAIGGPAVGAVPLVSAISAYSHLFREKLDAFFVRKEARLDRGYVETPKTIQPGSRVVLIDDVLTTGSAGMLALKRARDFGLDVCLFLTLVDREAGGRQLLEKEVRVLSVFNRSDFID